MTSEEKSIEQVLPHLLVVDDELNIRQMLTLVLQKSGYHVSCAENASEAFNLLEQSTFSAILSDVMMPGEDGISFLGRVHQSWPDLPVILMTGFAQLQMAINAIKNGAFDFIHKPFDFEYLRKIVDRAVNYTELLLMEKNYRLELEKTVARRTEALTKAMAELDFARAALLKCANDKSNFMANISHEMRTPMNCVVGSLDLLAEEGVDGVKAEYLAMARQSADNMVVLINQLLTFGGGAGQVAGTARYDLIDLVSDLKSITANLQPEFARKGLFLTLQIANDIPRQAWTDKECLNRLLGILLGNALKFTEKGGVTIDVSLGRSSTGNAQFCFDICDSGVGIPDGMLERIFEPFVQGDGSFTRRHDGAGLGLAIARQNALLLNGILWAEHVSGGGSSFKFTIDVITP
jgi:signal transduction histidine kinase